MYHPYGFNGKEENDENGIEWLDFGARNFDKWGGSWMNIDPLADKYYDLSPYSYTANNPVLFVDPDGRHIDISGLNKTQRRAFKKFLGTKQGRRFLLLYGSANQVVLGHKVGPTGGKYSHHEVFFISKNNQSFSNGKGGKTVTSFVSHPSGREIKPSQVSRKNLSRNLIFKVLIGENENEVEATETIGHEVFVHVESLAEGFEQLVSDYQSGEIGKQAKERGVSKNFVLIERIGDLFGDSKTKKDHKLFVNGKKVNYEEFIKELGSLYKRESEKGKKNTRENEEQ